jgi:two-component system response regulator MtrA
MTTVLLVEDDPAARQGLELALRYLGYSVHAAETGEAALRDIGDAAADVVVLDVMLPGLDGFEVCRRLRCGSDVPVIMLSQAQLDKYSECMRANGPRTSPTSPKAAG